MPRTSARFKRSLALLLMGAGLVAGVAHAWPTDPTINVPVHTGPGPQGPSSAVADGSGGAIILWSDSTTTSADVRATHLLGNGLHDPTWPVGGVAVCTAPGDQFTPHAVSDGAGGAIITWTDQRSGNFDIYAHHLLANGSVDPGWPVNGAVVAGGAGDQFAGNSTGSHRPTISDGAGGVLTTWSDSRSGNQDIYVHRVRATGIDPAWPVNGRAVCTAVDAQAGPTLVTDEAGGAIIAWHDTRGGGLPNSDIYAHHVNAAGTLDPDFPADGQVLCDAPNNQRYPEGVPDGAGGAVFAWHDRRNGADFDIYAQHIRADGTVNPFVTLNGVAVCVQPFDQVRVRAVPDTADGMLLSWHDDRDGISESVYAHHLQAGCIVDAAWPAHGLVVRQSNDDYFVGSVFQRGMVTDGAGGAIVTWQDKRSGGHDIYAQRIRPEGFVEPTWPNGGRAVCTAAHEQNGPSVVALGGGKVLVYWSDLRNGSYDAYAQRIGAGGELGGAVYVGSGQSLPQLRRGSLGWGDYDGDGDLDLLLTGTDGSQSRTYLYANNAGALTNVTTGLPDIEWSSAEWGDYDGDGDLDIAMAGLNNTTALARIYRNDGGTLIDIGANLPGVWKAAVAWGDVDRDGDLDLFLGGEQNNTVPLARVYRNDEGAFIALNAGLTGVYHCDADWGDVNHDGELDLLVSGNTGAGTSTSLYMNDGGDNFVEQGGWFPGVEAMDGSLAFGDYDNDGDLDVVLSGWDESNRRLAIFRNNGLGQFADIDANLPGLSSGAVAWGDYDNDGDLDILASGYWDSGIAGRTDIYCNDNGTFIDAAAGLPNSYYSAVAWADYDNDGDLDVTLSGTTDIGTFTHLLDSEGTTPNTPPPAPTGLSAVRTGGVVTFSWTAPTDAQTPASGLSYNLRVGTTSGGNSHVPSMSGTDGFRRIVRVGNAGRQTSFSVFLDIGAPFYWSVQAVDGTFAGSAWGIGSPVVGVEDDIALASPGLHGVSPNPFRTSTEILFALSRAGNVDVSVYDLGGRRVRVLEKGQRPAGAWSVRWDGRASSGARLPSGLYLVRLTSDSRVHSRKVVLTD